jgi:hypothetical protein
MNNEEMVISSPEKFKSHELINSVLFKWLEYHIKQDNDFAVVTMPASSGRHENQILDFIEERKDFYASDDHGAGINWLMTFDDRLEAFETNVLENDYAAYWQHQKCPDVFKRMLKHQLEIPVAAWFDLTGGLTDTTRVNMAEVIKKNFYDGDLFFVTLAIDGNIRGLAQDSHTKRMYDSFDKSRISRRFVTELLLKEMVSNTGKYMKPVIEPYVYRHGKTVYGVFGYIVGEKS